MFLPSDYSEYRSEEGELKFSINNTAKHINYYVPGESSELDTILYAIIVYCNHNPDEFKRFIDWLITAYERMSR